MAPIESSTYNCILDDEPPRPSLLQYQLMAVFNQATSLSCRNPNLLIFGMDKNTPITIRPATIDDAGILLEWRNDQTTRAASHNTEPVKESEHLDWMQKTLENPGRQLFIAECGDRPVGTVRVDHSDLSAELSWTVAPKLRGLGIGSRMVSLVAEQMRGAIRAEVKTENKASARIALHAGMFFDKEVQGVLHFSRGAI